MSRFASLDSIRKKEEEEQKKAGGDEYFAGGIDGRSGGGSGMAVQGPPPRRGDAFDNLVQRAAASAGSGGDAAPSENRRKITLYKNGFIIDDNGVLRDTTSPENAAFVQALEKGIVPEELRTLNGQPVVGLDVALEDRRGEEFVPPPPPAYTAFSGGSTLGGEKAEVCDEPTATCVFTQDSLTGVDATAAAIVEADRPSTTLQIKTPAGKRIRLTVNQGISVLQLAAVVARDTATAGNFTLSAGFPPKPLLNESRIKSVKDAGLAGASIHLNNA